MLQARIDGRAAPGLDGTWRKQRHEAYVEEFGLVEGHVEETAEGPVVRFERQFTEPLDAVWSVLTAAEGADPEVGGTPPEGCRTAGLSPGRVAVFDPDVRIETLWGHRGLVLEYTWRQEGQDTGRVRWELSEGPGGARVRIDQTVPDRPTELMAVALASWHQHLEALAERLVHGTSSVGEERLGELVAHYSGA